MRDTQDINAYFDVALPEDAEDTIELMTRVGIVSDGDKMRKYRDEKVPAKKKRHNHCMHAHSFQWSFSNKKQ